MLLVYHRMEYQQMAPGPQTLLTLCAMVSQDIHEARLLHEICCFYLQLMPNDIIQVRTECSMISLGPM